jgi:uncharacterized protein
VLIRLHELAVIFVSIILQSLPFVLVGVFASALVQRYLSEATVARWLPRRPLGAVALAGAFGFVAPVCDCGAIPLARRLAAKGVPTYAAVTFMLAAPVVNPVVLLSTLVAFQGDWRVAGLRLGLAFVVAALLGLATRALFPRAQLAQPAVGPLPLPVRGGSVDAIEETAPVRPVAARTGRGADLLAVTRHANREFFDVMFFVTLGALFTAAAQTLVPRGDLALVGGHPVWSVAALMPVATLLSICSEADAFVARAFAGSFSLGAVVAFMVIGQIVDLRNGFLMLRTLGTRLTLAISALAYALVFGFALAINLWGPSP